MDSEELQSKKDKNIPAFHEEGEGRKIPLLDTGLPVPDSYDETKLVILPRDPQWVFAYWEFNKEYLSGIKEKYGEYIFRRYPVILRSYDVTDVIFNGTNAHSYFDIEIDINTKNCYFRVAACGKNYCSEIGTLLNNGKFIFLVRSNTISMPSGEVSEFSDKEWMTIKEDLVKLIKVSGLALSSRSSQEMTKMLRNRIESILSLYSVSSPGRKFDEKR